MTGPDEPTPLETVGERYVLVEQIGGGDNREVWRAHDDLASRPVVLTRYLDRSDEWRRSFDRRATALEALSDPGIASALRHDAADETPWLASAWVDGTTVTELVAESGFTVDDALAVVGQAAFALAAARDAGIGHGRIDADHVVVRPDGSVALIGFAVDSAPSPDADLAALALLARRLVDSDGAELEPEVSRFLDWLTAGGGTRADNPAEVGRTALALASAQRGASGSTVVAPPSPAGPDQPTEAPVDARRPWYDEAERKRVRNRLIALGAIVVIGGAILLRIISAGAGQVTVPNVIGLPFVQAQHQLNQVGLRASETETTGTVDTVGTVIVQDPRPGTRTEVGALVHLTVVVAETR